MRNILKIFKERKREKERKNLEEIAEQDGVPFGQFRCGICKKALPCEYLVGPLVDYHYTTPYSVCSFCAWGTGLTRDGHGFLGHGEKDGHGYIDWERIKQWQLRCGIKEKDTVRPRKRNDNL